MCTLALRPDKPLFDLGHRKPSIRRCTAALSPSVTYIIPIIAGPLSAGLLVSGCFLRSHVMLARIPTKPATYSDLKPATVPI
jgi:hypothetical protein